MGENSPTAAKRKDSIYRHPYCLGFRVRVNSAQADLAFPITNYKNLPMTVIRSIARAATLALIPLACHGADTDLPSGLLNLQAKAITQKATVADGTPIEFIDLNPSIGRWILLKIPGLDGQAHWAHLDLGQEGNSKASLGADGNLHIEPRGAKPVVCKLDTAAARAEIIKNYSEPFTAICAGAAFVRSKPAKGYKSNLESVTDWLREQGPMGEKLITWRKDLFPHDGDSAQTGDGSAAAQSAAGPSPAPLVPGAPQSLSAANIGFKLASRSIGNGAWVPVIGAPGVWTSTTSASFVPPIFSDHKGSDSLAYFMAIELNAIDPRYSVGVDHPGVVWSSRAPSPHEAGGPDGFGSLDPLDRVGMVPPWAMTQLTAVIAGGFKREHSAFKAGPLSSKNHGSHYGFAEAGVILSKLQPGLATFFQRTGETAQIKVWGPEDEAKGSDKLIFARQNGLPLLENGIPGKDLAISFTGNWSGNQEGSPETMRSSLCIADRNGKSYLLYGVYSKAVPKDMAQILKAYNCKFAMQMDMNAPALTYAAVVGKDEKGTPKYMPLLGSMDDRNFGGTGRFTNTPDTRDFIYFERR